MSSFRHVTGSFLRIFTKEQQQIARGVLYRFENNRFRGHISENQEVCYLYKSFSNCLINTQPKRLFSTTDYFTTMETTNETKLLEELKSMQDQQTKQAELVRDLKKSGPKEEFEKQLAKLKELKAKVEAKLKEAKPAKIEFPRERFSRLMTQRFFLAPSFEIYGGVAGLYDLGPPGCAIKANLLAYWRQHYVLEENMLEVDCSSVTPESVLKTSGHVAKFADLMVKDVENGSCYRADHLLEQHLDKLLAQKDLSPALIDEYKTVQAQADAYSIEEMAKILKKYNVKAPDTNNDITNPEPFNLMFATMIGPSGQIKGYLRPETAQGMFVNFKRLLEFNGGKLPFAASQIGQAFRNEIAPRSGLLRVREFTLAEIEHFVNPLDKSHPKFNTIANLVVTLFPREDQVGSKKTIQLTIGEAVKNGTINNPTLGYFIARTYLFLIGAGVKKDRLRFRQHLADEMAHYATDCWDAEIQSSYGWVECVGIADRACFDLSAHATETKEPLSAFVEFPEGPRTIDAVDVKLDKSKIGKTFKKRGEILSKYLTALAEENMEACLQIQEKLQKGPTKIIVGAEEFEVTPDLVTIEKTKKKISGQHITPGVIEPSFGIGRILYSILEHAYYERENDEQRRVLGLTPIIAPVKVSVLPLLQSDQLTSFIPKITSLLTQNAISSKVDETGQSIGRRYARTDEIGIPFGITIDHETITSETITLRERDTTTQVRAKIADVPSIIRKLIDGSLTWDTVLKEFPKVEPTKE